MNKKGIKKLLLIISVCYIVLSTMIMLYTDLDTYERNLLDGNISITVISEDGTIEEYGEKQVFKSQKGDKVIAEINLPKELYIKDASICLRVYNSVVHLYYKDHLIYESGEELANNGRMIGSTYIRAVIPEEAWGESLRLECKLQENNSMTELSNVMALKTIYSLKYFIVDHQVEFIVFMTIISVSAYIFFCLLFYGKWTVEIRKGMYLSSCCFLIALWMLTYNGMCYMISDNYRVFANLEYISIFLSPLPIMLYLYEEKRESRFQKFYKAIPITFGIFLGIVTVLNYTTTYHYTSTLPVLHGIWAITILITIITYGQRKNNKSSNKDIVQYVIIATMLAFTVEMIHYNIDKYTEYRFGNTNSIAGLSILILLVTLAMSYSLQLGERYLGEKEKRYLERMAYLDGLTGLANRTGCYQYFESIKERHCISYTVVYMDLNNLKPLNDNYGHDEGDKLIYFLADQLKANFSYNAFCGRLGGDEFVAIVEEESSLYVTEALQKIEHAFTEANEKKQFPIDVSVAYGIAESTQINPLSTIEAMNIADHNMYEFKKRYKGNR